MSAMKFNFLSASKTSAHPKLPSSNQRKRLMGDFVVVMLGVLGLLGVHRAQADGDSTSTTLTLSSSLVTAGTVVTFTASVSNDSPVTAGTVTFCDATATYCENSAVVGTAQLTSSGTAVIRRVPAIGTHSYIAVFSPTSSNPGSTSTTKSLTVTGLYPSATAISSSGSAGNFTLTGTVVGKGSKTLGPTGNVSFLDTTNANYLLGSTTLGSATMADAYGAQVTYTAGTGPQAVAVGDFDRDGKLEMVVVNYGSNTVSWLKGNGDGTFQSKVDYATGTNPTAVAVGDLRNDGNLDLAVANYTAGTVSILLGNGNGTFAAKADYTVGTNPRGIALSDFDRDGKLELVVTNYGSNTVSWLASNGNGTFKTKVDYTTGTNPYGVVVGDFNGDGLPDLAVANYGANTVSVLIGKGDGTFQTKVDYAVGNNPQSITVGDFGGVGNADLAVTNSGSNTVSVLKGNGDGTFRAQVSYATGNVPYGLATGDFNGDGLADLVETNYGSTSAGVLVRNVTQTATAVTTGVSIPGSGSHQVDASYPGNTNFSSSTSSAISLTASPEATTLVLSANPTSSTSGQSVVLTATLSPSTLGNLTTSGETVTFYNGSTSVGTGTLNSLGVATFSTSTLPVGTASLTAVYAGDANFVGSTSPAFREVVDPTGTGVLNIQGRWEFAITSGDTATQLSTSGQSTISSYILQSGTALTNIVAFNTDTIVCDIDGLNNATVANSSIDAGGNVSITFTITDAESPTFQYVFTGIVTTGTPMTIIGTYQRTAGGCTLGRLGTGTPDGTFSATYFPDLSGTWTGEFDADTGTGPTSPATFVITTNPDKSLSGTVTTAMTNASSQACFVSTVTLQPGMVQGTSQASGIAMELFGSDTNGSTLWVNAYVTNPDGSVAAVGEDDPADGSNGTSNDGTNNTYTAFYGISGGPCDGLGGGDAPFKQVVAKNPPPKKHHGHNHRFHHHLKSEHRQMW